MSIGRTFNEALQKSIRSMEIGNYGLEEDFSFKLNDSDLSIQAQKEKLIETLSIPFSDRLWHVVAALRRGISIQLVNQLTGIDLWFLANLLILCIEL